MAVAVVLIHSYSSIKVDVDTISAHAFSMSTILGYIRILFATVIAHSAVPLFFIISGYLFFNKVKVFDKKIYIQKVKKRFHSLFVPYILWNILFVLWSLMPKVLSSLFLGKPWSRISEYFSDRGYFHMLWDCEVWDQMVNWMGMSIHNSGPVLMPFWFMRDLMLMVLITPFIYWGHKKAKGIFMLIIALIYFSGFRLPCFSSTLELALFYFSFGSFFAIQGRDFTEIVKSFKYAIGSVAIILMGTLTYLGSMFGGLAGTIIYPFVIFMECLFFIVLASLLCVRSRKVYDFSKRMASATFFIYAFHIFVLPYIMRAANKACGTGVLWQFISFILIPLVCIVICVACYWFMKKYVPKMLGVLIGERIL